MSRPERLEGRVRRGALWFALGYGGAQVLRFVGNVVLSRMLYAEAFGLMAIVTSVLQGLELFSDLGVHVSIVQSEREDRAFRDTAWTLQIARGLVLAMACVGLGGPVAAFYDAPELAWLLPVAGISVALASFASTKLAVALRDLELRRRELISLLSQVTGLVTMVVWAALDPSPAALVVGGIAGALVTVVLSQLALPGPVNRLAWEPDSARELIRVGRWVFISTLMHFVSSQSDKLLFGALLPMAALGVYHLGAVIARLPAEALGRFAFDVMFPVYRQVKAEGGPLAEPFDRLRRPVFVAAAWSLSGLLAGGPTAVQLVYDPRYHGAGTAIQWLAGAGWVYLVATTYSAMFLAAGEPKRIAQGDVAKALAMALGIPAGFMVGEAFAPGAGLRGALAGMLLADVLRYIVSVWLSVRHLGLWGRRLEVQLTLRLLAVGVPGAWLGAWMNGEGWPVVLRSAVIFVGVTACWWPLLGPYLRERWEARSAQ
ncbi:MAG: oligosaccharide flippase family protein [Myxococcota bacterium]